MILLQPFRVKSFFDFRKQRRDLLSVVQLLRDGEEILLSGLVPDPERWRKLGDLPHPWGNLIEHSVTELRSAGASLVPTLKRLRELAEDQRIFLEDAHAKSSLASVQALVCFMLAPSVGFGFYVLIPTLATHAVSWLLACLIAVILMGLGSVWLFSLAEQARWGGLASEKRVWILSSLCAGERFLALVKVGVPPDLAWAKTCDFMGLEAHSLVLAWGYSIWESPKSTAAQSDPELLILQLGGMIRKSVQMSLMEGKPCTERVESALFAFRQNLKTQIDRELSLLGAKTLQPLFICVAPALIFLMAFGFWLAAEDQMGDLLNVF